MGGSGWSQRGQAEEQRFISPFRFAELREDVIVWLLADESDWQFGNPRLSPQRNLDQCGEKRKRIALLAEDNVADVLLIQEAIEFHHVPIELYIVGDGEKAIEFFQKAEADPNAPRPELLLLDLNLPKMSGKEVLQRVRQSERCKNILVLILTSSDLSSDRDAVVALGANRYFRKPTSYSQFMKVGEIMNEILQE